MKSHPLLLWAHMLLPFLVLTELRAAPRWPALGTVQFTRSSGRITITASDPVRGTRQTFADHGVLGYEPVQAAGIVAWSENGWVKYVAYDWARGDFRHGQTSCPSGSSVDAFYNNDGVIAWAIEPFLSTAPDPSMNVAIYDPVKGLWVTGSWRLRGTFAGGRIENAEGVVGWLDQGVTVGSGIYVGFACYDPVSGLWQDSSHNEPWVPLWVQKMGVVAWANQSAVVGTAIYDPSRRQWMIDRTTYPSNATLLDVVNFSSVATVAGTARKRGYNVVTGTWFTTDTAPFVHHVVSPLSGNPPLRVWMWDMSVAATSWTWNFGDGSAASTRRSTWRDYANAGLFSVTETIQAGTAKSATVTVGAPPAITTQPSPTTAVRTAGGNITYAAAATGSSPLTYQWRKDGTALAAATGTSLALTNLQPSNSGVYTVVVTNPVGSATSNTVTLNVAAVAPSITAHPQNRTVVAGASASFAVTATGTAPLSYQWRKGGTAITGATNSSHAIASTQIADEGSYTVTVSNTAGSATSNAATLTVIPPGSPIITSQPQNQTIVAGTTAMFSVTATGDAPLSYQWRKSGTAIAGATDSSYTLATAQSADAGTYDVIISNSIGTATSNAVTLTVNEPLVITSADTTTFTVGQAGSFAFTASGTPPPTFSVSNGAIPSWGALNPASGVLSGTPPNTTGAPFVFTLTAANGVVPAATQSFSLHVALPPVFTTQPTGQTVNVGDSATFTAAATGTPPLSYQWRRNGAAIGGATSPTLTLPNVQRTDSGSYDVIVTNGVDGRATSNPAVLNVIPSGVSAEQLIALAAAVTTGGTIVVANRFIHSGPVANLRWSATLPTGWSLLGTDAPSANTIPAVGTTSLLEWSWTTVPTSPVGFAYTLSIPAGDFNGRSLAALVSFDYDGSPLQVTAKPDPLLAGFWHSVDSNRDFRISLTELTRVIELFNTHHGSTRTGAYRVQDGSEDGFAPDPARAPGAAVTLARYHSADMTAEGLRDGTISLVELTRVIALYNYRDGTTRTGHYHVQAGTEDGFATGP